MAPRNSQSHSSEMHGTHHSDAQAIAARRHGEAMRNPSDPSNAPFTSRTKNPTPAEYKAVSDFILVLTVLFFAYIYLI